MDHGQDGLGLVHVHFRVFHDFLICRLHFTETVIANEVASILLWLALESTKRLRHASSTQTTNIRFFLAVKHNIRAHFVQLIFCDAVFVPVLVQCCLCKVLHFYNCLYLFY